MTSTAAILCSLISSQMNMPEGTVFIWNQKVTVKGPGMYITVQVIDGKPIASNPTYRWDGTQYWEDIIVNYNELIQIDVISRTTEAIDRHIEVVALLTSQATNEESQRVGMKIQLLPSFTCVSQADGEAIPYRYVYRGGVTRVYTQSKPALWYDHGFVPAEVITNP